MFLRPCFLFNFTDGGIEYLNYAPLIWVIYFGFSFSSIQCSTLILSIYYINSIGKKYDQEGNSLLTSSLDVLECRKFKPPMAGRNVAICTCRQDGLQSAVSIDLMMIPPRVQLSSHLVLHFYPLPFR